MISGRLLKKVLGVWEGKQAPLAGVKTGALYLSGIHFPLNYRSGLLIDAFPLDDILIV